MGSLNERSDQSWDYLDFEEVLVYILGDLLRTLDKWDYCLNKLGHRNRKVQFLSFNMNNMTRIFHSVYLVGILLKVG